MKVAYIRVSSIQQKIDRQEIIMERLGVEKVYIEKASGKNTDRPVLNEMLTFLREGDELVVESISRFARNTRAPYGNVVFEVNKIESAHFARWETNPEDFDTIEKILSSKIGASEAKKAVAYGRTKKKGKYVYFDSFDGNGYSDPSPVLQTH